MDIPLPNVEPPKKDATPVDVAKEFQKQSQYMGEVADSVIQDAAQTAQSLGQTYDPAYMYGKYMNPVIGSVRSDIEQQGALMAGDKAITQAQEQAEERMKQAQENYKKAQQARAARIAAENERRAREANSQVNIEGSKEGLTQNQADALHIDGKTKSIVDWIKRTPNWGEQIGDEDARILGYKNAADMRSKTQYSTRDVVKDSQHKPKIIRKGRFTYTEPQRTKWIEKVNPNKEIPYQAVVAAVNAKIVAISRGLDPKNYNAPDYAGVKEFSPQFMQAQLKYPEQFKQILSSAHQVWNNAVSVKYKDEVVNGAPKRTYTVRVPEAAIKTPDVASLKLLIEKGKYIDYNTGKEAKVKSEEERSSRIADLVKNITNDHFVATQLEAGRAKDRKTTIAVSQTAYDVASFMRSKNMKTPLRIRGITFGDLDKAMRDEDWELLGINPAMFSGVHFASKHEKISAAIAALLETGSEYNNRVSAGATDVINLDDPFAERRSGIFSAIGGAIGTAGGAAAGFLVGNAPGAVKAGIAGNASGAVAGKAIGLTLLGQSRVDSEMVNLDHAEANAMAIAMLEMAKKQEGDNYQMKDEWGRQLLGSLGNAWNNSVFELAEVLLKTPETIGKIASGDAVNLLMGKSPYEWQAFSKWVNTGKMAEENQRAAWDYFLALEPEYRQMYEKSFSTGTFSATSIGSFIGGFAAMPVHFAAMNGIISAGKFAMGSGISKLAKLGDTAMNGKAAKAIAKGLADPATSVAYMQSLGTALEAAPQMYHSIGAVKAATQAEKAAQSLIGKLKKLSMSSIAERTGAPTVVVGGQTRQVQKAINTYLNQMTKIGHNLLPSQARLASAWFGSSASDFMRTVASSGLKGKQALQFAQLKNEFGYVNQVVRGLTKFEVNMTKAIGGIKNYKFVAGALNYMDGKGLGPMLARVFTQAVAVEPKLLAMSALRKAVVDERTMDIDEIKTQLLMDTAFAGLVGMGREWGRVLKNPRAAKPSTEALRLSGGKEATSEAAGKPTPAAIKALKDIDYGKMTFQEYYNAAATEAQVRLISRYDDPNYLPRYKEYSLRSAKMAKQLDIEVNAILTHFDTPDDFETVMPHLKEVFSKHGLPTAEAETVAKEWKDNMAHLSHYTFGGTNLKYGTSLTEVAKQFDPALVSTFEGNMSIDPEYTDQRVKSKNLSISVQLLTHSYANQVRGHIKTYIDSAEKAKHVVFGSTSPIAVEDAPFEVPEPKLRDQPVSPYVVKFGKKTTEDYKNLMSLGRGSHKVKFVETTFRGEPAIKIMSGNNRVGYVPKEMAKRWSGKVPKNGFVDIGGTVTFRFLQPEKIKAVSIGKDFKSVLTELPATQETIKKLEAVDPARNFDLGSTAHNFALFKSLFMDDKSLTSNRTDLKKIAEKMASGKELTTKEQKLYDHKYFKEQIDDWFEEYTKGMDTKDVKRYEAHIKQFTQKTHYENGKLVEAEGFTGENKLTDSPQDQAFLEAFEEQVNMAILPTLEEEIKNLVKQQDRLRKKAINDIKTAIAKNYVPDAIPEATGGTVKGYIKANRKAIADLNKQEVKVFDMIHNVETRQPKSPQIQKISELVEKLPSDDKLGKLRIGNKFSRRSIVARINRAAEMMGEEALKDPTQRQAAVESFIKALDDAAIQSFLSNRETFFGSKLTKEAMKPFIATYNKNPDALKFKKYKLSSVDGFTDTVAKIANEAFDSQTPPEKTSYSMDEVESAMKTLANVEEAYYDNINNYVTKGEQGYAALTRYNLRSFYPDLEPNLETSDLVRLVEVRDKANKYHRAAINAHNTLEIIQTGEALYRMKHRSRHVMGENGPVRVQAGMKGGKKVMTDLEWRYLGAEATGKMTMLENIMSDTINDKIKLSVSSTLHQMITGQSQLSSYEERSYDRLNGLQSEDDTSQLGSSSGVAIEGNTVMAWLINEGAVLADSPLAKRYQPSTETKAILEGAEYIPQEMMVSYVANDLASQLAYKRAQGKALTPEDNAAINQVRELTSKQVNMLNSNRNSINQAVRDKAKELGYDVIERQPYTVHREINGVKVKEVVGTPEPVPILKMDSIDTRKSRVPKAEYLKMYSLYYDTPTPADFPYEKAPDVEEVVEAVKHKKHTPVHGETAAIEELDPSEYVLLNPQEKLQFSAVDPRFNTEDPVKVTAQNYQFLQTLSYAHKTHNPGAAMRSLRSFQEFALTTGFRSLNAYNFFVSGSVAATSWNMPTLALAQAGDFIGEFFDKYHVAKVAESPRMKMVIAELDSTGYTKFGVDLLDARMEYRQAPVRFTEEWIRDKISFVSKFTENWQRAVGPGGGRGGRNVAQAAGHIIWQALANISDDKTFNQYIPMAKLRMTERYISKRMKKAGLTWEEGVSKNPEFRKIVQDVTEKIDALFSPGRHENLFRNKKIMRDGHNVNPTQNPELEFHGQHKVTEAMVRNSGKYQKFAGGMKDVAAAILFAPNHFMRVLKIPYYAGRGIVDDKFRLHTKMLAGLAIAALLTGLMNTEEDDWNDIGKLAEKVWEGAGKIFIVKGDNEIFVDVLSAFKTPFRTGADIVSGKTTVWDAFVNRTLGPIRGVVQAGTNRGYFGQEVIKDENGNPIDPKNDPLKYYASTVWHSLKSTFTHGYLQAAEKALEVDKDGNVTIKDDPQSWAAFLLDAVDAPVKFKDLQKEAKRDLFRIREKIQSYAKSLNFNSFTDPSEVQVEKRNKILDYAIKELNRWNVNFSALGRGEERSELAANIAMSALISPKNAAATAMEAGYGQEAEQTDIVHARNALRNKYLKKMKERGLKVPLSKKHKERIEKYDQHADYSQFVLDFKNAVKEHNLNEEFERMNAIRSASYLDKDYKGVEYAEAQYMDSLHSVFLGMAAKYGDEFLNQNMWRIIKNNGIAKYFIVPQKDKIEFRKKNKLGPWSTKQLHPVDYYNDKWGLKAGKMRNEKEFKMTEKMLMEGWTIGTHGKVYIKTRTVVDDKLQSIKDDLKRGKVSRARLKMMKLSSPKVYKTPRQVLELNEYVISQKLNRKIK